MSVVSQPRSMFTCLYIESLLGLMVTLAVFMHFGMGYVRTADLDIFADDGMHHAQRYVESRYDRHGLYERLNRMGELTFYDYKLSLLKGWDEEQPLCTHCTLHISSQGVRIYMDEDELLMMASPIPNANYHLVFFGRDQSAQREDEGRGAIIDRGSSFGFQQDGKCGFEVARPLSPFPVQEVEF